MCGLFGYSLRRRPTAKERQQLVVFSAVLAVSMDNRGGDAWGIALDGQVYRGLGEMCEGFDLFEIPRARTIMGHCRFATHGTKDIPNTHPFEMGHIVGSHNGVIHNHESLNTRYCRRYAVDSQHIFAAIAEGRDISDLEGYGTLEWYEKTAPHRIHIGYFNHADCHVWVLSGLGYAWASTGDALVSAAGAAQLRGHPIQVNARKLYVVEGGELRGGKLPSGWWPKSYTRHPLAQGYYWSGAMGGYDWSDCTPSDSASLHYGIAPSTRSG